ncbi:hypothetical protein [Rummeliibacillus sp. TYF-LIM-RU47]|nr:hypothetical protein [Rummeliibacillus sp. TYF-LIM-RU47]
MYTYGACLVVHTFMAIAGDVGGTVTIVETAPLQAQQDFPKPHHEQ